MLFPYAGFNVRGPSPIVERFQFGGYDIWRDSEENWKEILRISRPSQHLTTYVDRHGNPVNAIWVASPTANKIVSPEDWQHLVAALFYLCWVRVLSGGPPKPSADNFYFEMWNLPEGAQEDSPHHVRYSKYGATSWSKLSIHPGPDVSPNGTILIIPGSVTVVGRVDLEALAKELFRALDSALKKPESSALTALWFFFNCCYQSPSRASYAEDIQNMCTAFEALLEIGKRGDSDGQVSKGLTRLFRVTAPDRVGAPSGASPPEEEPETLEQLRKWVAALYNIRNAYTHGKKVQDFDYLFCGRSIWVDCFEIFSLAANRVLLGNSERRLIQGIPLTKLLMSGIYLEELINELRKGRGIFDVQQSDPTVRVKLKKLLEKGMAVDPARIEQVRSLPQFREALYQLAGLIYYGLTKAAQEEISKSEISGLLSDLETAYEKTYDGSAKGGRSFDVSKYLRSVAPAITSMGYRALPVIGDDILLYQLTDNFKMMYRLYRDFENSQAPPSLQTRTPQPAN